MFADMRDRAGVNVLFPFIYSHEPHRAGVDAANFHGGNYAHPHMQFYKDTPLTLQDMSAPEFGGADMLEKIIPIAKKHGIRVFCFLLEDNTLPASVKNWESLYEVDHHGRRTTGHPSGPCFNNPAYQNFTLGLVEDYARSYDIGGHHVGLGTAGRAAQHARHFPEQRTRPRQDDVLLRVLPEGAGRAIAGLMPLVARQGFGEMETFVRNSRAGQRPRDGYFTEFWRLLLKYPEVLACENLWATSRHEFQAAIYKKVKSINPALQVGWHVWQNVSFSPFQRAEENLSDLAAFSDFIRPALYNNVAGGRFVSFVKGVRGSVFGDLSSSGTAEMFFQQLNYSEAPYDKLAATGFSPDYVERETRRAVEAMAGHPVQIWPGVDIDVPVSAGESHCTPESVAQAVKAVFWRRRAGDYFIAQHQEMKPENLSGAGTALRELRVI